MNANKLRLTVTLLDCLCLSFLRLFPTSDLLRYQLLLLLLLLPLERKEVLKNELSFFFLASHASTSPKFSSSSLLALLFLGLLNIGSVFVLNSNFFSAVDEGVNEING